MTTTPYQVIQNTRSPVVQLTLLRAEGEIQKAIQSGPGGVDYFTTFEVQVAHNGVDNAISDNDVYAIKALLKNAGWANVYVCGGILYFDFPPLASVEIN